MVLLPCAAGSACGGGGRWIDQLAFPGIVLGVVMLQELLSCRFGSTARYSSSLPMACASSLRHARCGRSQIHKARGRHIRCLIQHLRCASCRYARARSSRAQLFIFLLGAISCRFCSHRRACSRWRSLLTLVRTGEAGSRRSDWSRTLIAAIARHPAFSPRAQWHQGRHVTRLSRCYPARETRPKRRR